MKAQTIMCACGMALLLLAEQTQAFDTTIPVTTNGLQGLQIVFSQSTASVDSTLAMQSTATADQQSLRIVFAPPTNGVEPTLETLPLAESAMAIPFTQNGSATAKSAPDVSAVPEPGTLALMGLGMLGLLRIVRRKRAL